MSLLRRTDPTAVAETRLGELRAEHAQCAAELPAARAELGRVVALGDDDRVAAARSRVAELIAREEGLSAALPVAEAAAREARDEAAAAERQRLLAEVAAAERARLACGEQFDEAAAQLGARAVEYEAATERLLATLRAAGVERSNPLHALHLHFRAALWSAAPTLSRRTRLGWARAATLAASSSGRAAPPAEPEAPAAPAA